jgi:hypothetical protein
VRSAQAWLVCTWVAACACATLCLPTCRGSLVWLRLFPVCAVPCSGHTVSDAAPPDPYLQPSTTTTTAAGGRSHPLARSLSALPRSGGGGGGRGDDGSSGAAAASSATLAEALKQCKAAGRAPEQTLQLAACRVSPAPKAHPHALEIEERTTTLLLFASSRKVVLRAEDAAEAERWLRLLQAGVEAGKAFAAPPSP